jgi:glycosyltransferase involved in cell wall biosynthesis
MKILWLAHEGNISGANICLLEFLDILNDANTTNYLVIPWAGSMASKAEQKVKKLSAVKFYSWVWPLQSPPASLTFRTRRWLRNRKAVNDIARLIHDYNPDFVVTNTVVTPVAALAAKKAGKKHVWFIHEFGEEDHGYSIAGKFSKAAKIINDLSYKVAFNSNAVLEKYKSFVPADKRYIVHNASITQGEPVIVPANGGPIRLLMLGQVSPSKNQLEALKALRICLDKGINVQLSIAGKAEGDSYLNILNSYIDDNSLSPYVHFLGSTDNPQKVLEKNEALLMCSRMEAFGRVTVEALKNGVPVIAANKGGTTEIISDGNNGYLYEAGNAEDLAEKIIVYSKNKQHFNRQQISVDARNTYNFKNTQQQLLQVFC